MAFKYHIEDKKLIIDGGSAEIPGGVGAFGGGLPRELKESIETVSIPERY